MTSIVNKYFHKSNILEQNMMSGFIKETIQIKGHEYFYLPRDVQIEDLILGEDIISKFSIAIPIEMYLVDATGFTGDREMFAKFGLEIRNSFKLVVHKERWEEEIKSQFDSNLLNGEANFTINNYIRPREGDLIYDPLTKYLVEVKFVDHDIEFYSLGRNYQYYLSCEAFQYQNEVIETGNAVIDLFSLNSKDILENQIILQNNNSLEFEQGGYLVKEDGNIPAPIRDYGTEFNPPAEQIKFTVNNPFDI